MASGFGARGRNGRCYSFWKDFQNCLSNADSPKNCADLRDDYSECLHHKKEFSRINRILITEHQNETPIEFEQTS